MIINDRLHTIQNISSIPSGPVSDSCPGPNEEQQVYRLIQDGKEIILVGTAHMSGESAALVERVIKQEMPATVCLELCRTRLEVLRQKAKWQEMDIVQVFRTQRASLLLFQLLLASVEKKLTKELPVYPGEDMLRALTTAEACNALILPMDREIRITLLRAWRSLRFLDQVSLVPEMLISLFFTEDITAEEKAKLEQQDTLEIALRPLAGKLPSLRSILIDERDRCLAQAIRQAPGPKIVALISAGHVAGIRESIDKDIDLLPLLTIPPAGFGALIIGWSVPIFIIGLLLTGIFSSDLRAGLNLTLGWSAVTAAFSGLGALLLLAHPLTIIASVFAAPFTTVYPLLASGWVAGITEAGIRRPRVADFLDLARDFTSIRGLFSNRVTRVLLLVAIVNLTTSIGTFAAIPLIMRFF